MEVSSQWSLYIVLQLSWNCIFTEGNVFHRLGNKNFSLTIWRKAMLTGLHTNCSALLYHLLSGKTLELKAGKSASGPITFHQWCRTSAIVPLNKSMSRSNVLLSTCHMYTFHSTHSSNIWVLWISLHGGFTGGGPYCNLENIFHIKTIWTTKFWLTNFHIIELQWLHSSLTF